MDILGLKAALKTGEVTVNFTKVNGAKRVMVATQSPAIAPETKEGKTNKTKDANLLIVFDTQIHGWRTIRVDSIASWEVGVSEAATSTPVPETPPTIGWSPNTSA